MRRSVSLKKIAIIGNGSQSKRIQRILNKLNLGYFIYHPSNKQSKITFGDVLVSDAVFICSPNNTHIEYIKKLGKNKYIFCEKPPVNKIIDLKYLKKEDYKKLYFNFNYRFSSISKILKDSNKFKLGNLLYGSIIFGHGLASKKEYINSWRSKKNECPKGVFEVVSVHIIDLINFYFNVKKINLPTLTNVSGIGNSYDTSKITINLSNNSHIDIFSTYFSPYHEEWSLIYENGIIKFENGILVIRGPKNIFNKKGFFKKPKIIYKKLISEQKDFDDSLVDSTNYFISVFKKNKPFPKEIFKKSLDTNWIILK